MEMKSYQRQAIDDLSRYMELLNEAQDYAAAFSQFWQEKSAPALGHYQDILPGVPNLCFKVPTGGGKTFLACNALRPVFDALPMTKMKAVVWLVPSDAILSQTLKNLQDSIHPYRQAIDVAFGGRVTVYSKQELLSGQNFNITAVTEQLSIMVLSYDSFRGRSNEALKAYRENSSLAPMAKALGKPQQPIEKADDTALFQVINQLSPLVIVDESHHARSELSLDMLKDFNPCFVLELTATPKKNSNILSYVDAAQLKAANMVKLPVIVYNRGSQQEVITDAIDLRRNLERLAEAERSKSGKYIRPIVLFQAQPKGKENSTTFEKLRDKLVDAGIPADEIAIRTADINELKNVDLLSESCPIRYIITINALKEGWDCPFAYILASIANKTSPVDVEQILGRVLRLPHTCQHSQPSLNMSYVLTSSSDFDQTVKQIVRGLNHAGFTDRDYRMAEPPKPATPSPTQTEPLPSPLQESVASAEDEFLAFDSTQIAAELANRTNNAPDSPAPTHTMLEEAEKVGETYNRTIEENAGDLFTQNFAWEVQEKVNTFPVKPEFADDIKNLWIPQFFQVVPQSLFHEGTLELLEKEQLASGFTLKGKAYDIDFGSADDELVQVDVRTKEGSVPKVFKMSDADQRYFKEYFNSKPEESRVKMCKDIMFRQLNKLDMVDAVELWEYLERIVNDMDKPQLAAMEKSPLGYAAKIRDKIDTLLTQHYKDTFHQWIETEKVICSPSYQLPSVIHPANSTSFLGGSLYQAEEDMNELEQDLVMELTALPNVRWWHRNISRQGFCINGFIHHYPDIMVMTKSGKVILVETKGGHLKNDDSRDKLELGKAWQHAAGSMYRYYMVFRDEENLLPGAVSMKQFVELVKQL